MAADNGAPRLKQRYLDDVAPRMRGEFSFSNPMQVPRLTKIVVNTGVGEALSTASILDAAVADITAICGQRHGDHQSHQIDRQLQAARGQLRRRHLHDSRAPNVGVSGPHDQRPRCRAFATFRASRAQRVRRPTRQLQPRHSRDRPRSSTRSTTARSIGCAGCRSTIISTARNDAEGRRLPRAARHALRARPLAANGM